MTDVCVKSLCSFPCRCGGEISLVEKLDDGEAMALHTQPHCSWFEGADKNNFLDECEKHPKAWHDFVNAVLD